MAPSATRRRAGSDQSPMHRADARALRSSTKCSCARTRSRSREREGSKLRARVSRSREKDFRWTSSMRSTLTRRHRGSGSLGVIPVAGDPATSDARTCGRPARARGKASRMAEADEERRVIATARLRWNASTMPTSTRRSRQTRGVRCSTAIRRGRCRRLKSYTGMARMRQGRIAKGSLRSASSPKHGASKET